MVWLRNELTHTDQDEVFMPPDVHRAMQIVFEMICRLWEHDLSWKPRVAAPAMSSLGCLCERCEPSLAGRPSVAGDSIQGGALGWPADRSRRAAGHSIMSTCSTRRPSASLVTERWTCAPGGATFAFGSVPGGDDGGAKSTLESMVLIDPSLLRNGLPSGPPRGIRLGSLFRSTVPSGLTQRGLGGAVLLRSAVRSDSGPVSRLAVVGSQC